MKKQIRLNWQMITFVAFVSLAVLFAVNSPAIAQATYKVGDRVEFLLKGKWVEAEITKVEDDQYEVERDDETGTYFLFVPVKHAGKYLRPIKAKAQTDNRNNADNQGQNQTTFKAGDRVEVDGTGIGWWSKATVTKLDIIDGTFFGYWVKLDNGRETRIGKKPEDIRALKEDGANEQPKEQPKEENKPDKQPPAKKQPGRFKVGERVKASPMSMIGDEYFENCTVIKDYLETEGYDTYRVLCDDPNGGIGKESNVKVPYIRAWPNATPPPATPQCNFNEPAGTVSKNSKPSEQLFKRVIFERYRDQANGRKVGITYQTFQLGTSYVNRLTNNGLLHDGAPQDAVIYPVKTRYIFCDRYTDSTIRWVYDAQYSCFKDKFGDWVCPSDSTKPLEQTYLKNE